MKRWISLTLIHHGHYDVSVEPDKETRNDEVPQ